MVRLCLHRMPERMPEINIIRGYFIKYPLIYDYIEYFQKAVVFF